MFRRGRWSAPKSSKFCFPPIFLMNPKTVFPHLSVPLEPMPPEADLGVLDAERNLYNLTREESAGGTACQTVLARGQLWNVICGIFARRNIDLVVAGTHGRLGLRKLVLGSNAEICFRQREGIGQRITRSLRAIGRKEDCVQLPSRALQWANVGTDGQHRAGRPPVDLLATKPALAEKCGPWYRRKHGHGAHLRSWHGLCPPRKESWILLKNGHPT
jgi:hypothetical protein